MTCRTGSGLLRLPWFEFQPFANKRKLLLANAMFLFKKIRILQSFFFKFHTIACVIVFEKNFSRLLMKIIFFLPASPIAGQPAESKAYKRRDQPKFLISHQSSAHRARCQKLLSSYNNQHWFAFSTLAPSMNKNFN